jgi:hypothetical protein
MTTTTIADDWRCDALEPRDDPNGHRCESCGLRYRGRHWVCFRHFDKLANQYYGGGVPWDELNERRDIRK